jgi:antitoxin component YwqK of YwqJK toxin-antitoxin module
LPESLRALYSYDTDGFLSKKRVFTPQEFALKGFIPASSTEYAYRNGLLISEKELFPSGNIKEERKYEYQNNRLTTLYVHNNNKLSYSSQFEYENGRIAREIPTTGKRNI